MATLPRKESDPVAEGDLATHEALTKGVHAIADTSAIATKAEVTDGDALALPLAGGTMTGALLLAGDPTDGLGAATRQFVLANGGGGGSLEWTALPYEAEQAEDFGEPYAPAAYSFDNNLVYFQGLAKSLAGNSNVLIATLPEGARPARKHAVLLGDANSPTSANLCTIEPNGEFKLVTSNDSTPLLILTNCFFPLGGL